MGLNENAHEFFSSYILFVPFETDDDSESGIVYVWMGSKTTAEESRLIQEIAEDMFNNPWVSLQVRVLIYLYFEKTLKQKSSR